MLKNNVPNLRYGTPTWHTIKQSFSSEPSSMSAITELMMGVKASHHSILYEWPHVDLGKLGVFSVIMNSLGNCHGLLVCKVVETRIYSRKLSLEMHADASAHKLSQNWLKSIRNASELTFRRCDGTSCTIDVWDTIFNITSLKTLFYQWGETMRLMGR